MDFWTKKIAIVCDWIIDWGGAERVLEQFLKIFPQADIYTSVCFSKNPVLKNHKVHTSFLQKIPILGKKHKFCALFRFKAFEDFNLDQYDIVISSSSAESKNIITSPDTLHVCYCHSPIRYYWSHAQEYIHSSELGWIQKIFRGKISKMIHNMRQTDFLAAQRPDFFLANSSVTQKRIEKYYWRDSEILHPSIDHGEFFLSEKKDFFLAIGRIVSYKRFDLAIDACNRLGKKLIIITSTENALQKKLEKKSGPTIEWKKNISWLEIKKYYSEAQALVFPQEEDFGIVPLESMASGTPVIAYGKWGALESVSDGVSGIFFPEQTVDSLSQAILDFEGKNFHPEKIRESVKKFDHKNFREKFIEVLRRSN